ncbi:DUF551 domain-containing protein [Citrobacter werkmanii]|nr:DUF551 domain-containing protein [Citrobacter werkmanii]MDO8233993.1 DUF551 domain-containing protein [Citrobacter werkmanii]
MVVHSGDAKENVDCRLPFDQWLSQQNEPIDVDCGCVTTEAFYHWLRVAYEAGNSPATPDTWIPVSERMPEWSDDVLCATEFDGPGDWRKKVGYWHQGRWVIYGASWTPTYWMPLPAAPKL